MKTLLLISFVAICRLTNAQSIAAGYWHSLAICNDSAVRAWGYNLYGQLGDGSNIDTSLPVSVSTLTGVTAIFGGFHSLALKSDSTVWAWGYNLYGQLGNGNNTDINVPIIVSSLAGIKAIGGGVSHSLALKNDGSIWSWGYNSHGQLGNGTNNDSNVPIPVSSLTNISAVKGGAQHSLALKNDSTVWAWGRNNSGQLGDGTNTDSNVPVHVSSLTNIIAIAAGYFHSLGLKNDSTVWAWGNNTYGELGNGTFANSSVAVQVSSLTGIIAIAGGEHHSLALKSDSTVWAWGLNYYGELGNGTNINTNLPVQVSFLTGIIAIAGGDEYSLALKSDGTVWAWGYNFYGQFGNGTNVSSNIPVLVTGPCSSSIPNVSLYSSDTSFCEKQCINFFDLSTNNPTSWQWFFPGADSTTSTLQNPTNICYSTYGSFDVILIACNAGGCDTLILPGFINEYPLPTATITQSNDTLFSSSGVSYQWYSVATGSIAGATNNYFAPTQTGDYYVIVTDSIGCAGTSNVISITGINEFSVGSFQLAIIPNPNNGSFTVSLNELLSKDFSIRIIDPIGRTISNWQCTVGNRQFSIDINIRDVAKGLYAIQVINNNKVYRERFVVQ